MDFREMIFAERVSSSSLKAATTLDRLSRGIAVDMGPINEFLVDIEAIYGAAPRSVWDAVGRHDPQFLCRLKQMALDTHDVALAYRPGGPFSDDDFDLLMAQSKPLTAKFLEKINELVGDVQVDLEEPLEGEVAI